MTVKCRVATVALVCLLTGCAGQRAFDEGQALQAAGQYEAAIRTYDAGLQRYPEDAKLRQAADNARDQAATRLLAAASAEHAAGHDDVATNLLDRIRRLQPGDPRPRAVKLDFERDRRVAAALNEAQELFKAGQLERAQLVAEAGRREAPGNVDLIEVQRQVEFVQRREEQAGGPRLTDGRPISLEFRDANLRMVLEALTRSSGTNFIVDKDVRPDLKATIFLRQTRLEDAIDLICSTNQLGKKVLDGQTVLIYPNTPEKNREYQDLVIRAFYLSNSNVKQTATLLKSMLKLRDPFVDEKLNLIVIRESPETVRLAERLVALHDVPEGEVMLEVEVIEVTQTRLTALGIDYPSSLTLTPLNLAGNAPAALLSELSGLNRNRIGINTPSVTLNLQRQVGNSSLLANPKIRVRNHEKAKILIGDKLPIVTSTATATGFVSESIQYIEVGLKLEVEPTIYPDGQVGISLALEVSSPTDTIKTSSGTVAYRIGTRTTNTALQLQDGETQIMAGLINRREQSSSNRIPGLGDIPVLGRLFSAQTDNGDRSEIVLSLTPRIVRALRRPDLNQAEFWSGTENNVRNRPLTLATRGAPNALGVAQGALAGQPGAAFDVYGQAIPSATPPSAAGPNAAPTGTAPTATANVLPTNFVFVPSPPTANAPAISTLTTQPLITLRPPPKAKRGETFELPVQLRSSLPVRGLPMKLTYNPALLQLVDVREGDFFKQGDAKVSISKSVEEGRASVGAIRNSADGAQGEGVAVVLVFKALATGTAQVAIGSLNALGVGAEVPPPTVPAPASVLIE